MNRSLVFKSINILSYAVTILSLLYIGRLIVTLSPNISRLLTINNLIWIILFSIILCLQIFGSALLWKSILNCLNEFKSLTLSIIKAYVTSNIAKYLPGNFMHYVGRNFLVEKYGFSHLQIISTTILEIIFNLKTSLILIIVMMISGVIAIPYVILSKINVFTILCLTIIALSVFAYLIKCSKKGFIEYFKKLSLNSFLLVFLKFFIVSVIFFLVTSLIIFLIYEKILGSNINYTDIIQIFGAYLTAWIAGYITVGAPGGIGVRESVLILMLSSHFGQESSLIMALILRFSVIIAELTAFLTGVTLLNNQKEIPVALE